MLLIIISFTFALNSLFFIKYLLYFIPFIIIIIAFLILAKLEAALLNDIL